MAIGERFRSGGAHGIARFLAEHQSCNSGFDVRRDDQLGSGKLSITCEGCGASVEYRAAEAGELAAGGLAAGGPQAAPIPANGAPGAHPYPAAPPAPSAPTPPTPPAASAPPSPPPPVARPVGTPGLPAMRRPQPSSSRGRRGVIPGWVSVALIGALILGGLTMIAIGLTKDNDEQPAVPPGGQTPARGKPGGGQTPKPANQQPATGQNQQPAQQPAGGAATQAPAATALNRRTFADRFSIGVPAGWEDGMKEGGIALTARGATAEIVVFFQAGATPEPELAQGARRFLAERHAGAQIGGAKPIRIGAEKGLRVVATYQGGEEVAVVISAGGFSHVILRRVDRGASPDLEQQADAAVTSFKPL